MALIRPFKALRPDRDKASLVAALPYDVMDSIEAKHMAKDNTISFLHVDKAEIDLDETTDIYSDAVYEKAAENLKKLEDDGVLINENKPCLYVYRLTRNGHSQTGLVCCTSIDDYLNGIIKKHELTKEVKEKDRTNHILHCNANTGPIFLTYKVKKPFEEIEKTTENEPLYDFTSNDGIRHTVWIIDNDEEIEKLIAHFSNVPYLYIADGHHRNASAVNAALKKRQENPDYTGDEEFNYCLSVIFPSNELEIMDYNRIVKDLNGLTEDEFLQKISEKFFIRPYTRLGSFKPFMAHQFGMYLGNKWYILTFDEDSLPDDPVKRLDVSILYDNLLSPVLGIGNPRTDERIDYVGGIRGLAELERMVILGKARIAFSMYPTSIDELMNIADNNLLMPPKSTWFEPKLRSGLFIHKFD